MATKHYLDPHNAAFATAIANAPLPNELGYAEGHKALEDLQKNDPASDITTETIQVPFQDVSTNVMIFRPKASTKSLPIVFYMHGGGWILGG